MAKSNNQKAKILYLEKMLRETGEHRVISMQKILENLEKQGIRAERKSIYDDVEVLRSFGMDIRYTRERPGGYYLAGESAGEEQPSTGDISVARGIRIAYMPQGLGKNLYPTLSVFENIDFFGRLFGGGS